jgi:hypothetical protein
MRNEAKVLDIEGLIEAVLLAHRLDEVRVGILARQSKTWVE